MEIERFDVPTVEAVLAIGCDRETAEKVVAVLAGELDPCEASEKCAAWVRACYHRPDTRKHEALLLACADLLGMHDVASLEIEGERHYTDEGIRMCPPFSYANAGDTYVTTLARDHERGQWVIASWGDLCEEYEREHKIGDHEEFDEAPERCPSCGEKGTFKLESYNAGSWESGQWVSEGTRYSFVCGECNHSCHTPEDFEPPTPRFRLTDIEWDADDSDADLPESIVVEAPSADEAVDAASDKTGFCIRNATVEPTDDDADD